jgi:hypothetical protein
MSTKSPSRLHQHHNRTYASWRPTRKAHTRDSYCLFYVMTQSFKCRHKSCPNVRRAQCCNQSRKTHKHNSTGKPQESKTKSIEFRHCLRSQRLQLSGIGKFPVRAVLAKVSCVCVYVRMCLHGSLPTAHKWIKKLAYTHISASQSVSAADLRLLVSVHHWPRNQNAWIF